MSIATLYTPEVTRCDLIAPNFQKFLRAPLPSLERTQSVIMCWSQDIVSPPSPPAIPLTKILDQPLIVALYTSTLLCV